MQYRLRTLLIVLALGPPLLAGAWLILAGVWVMEWRGLSSNCGGNNAARTYVAQHAFTMILFATDNPRHEFALGKATAQQRKELASLSTSWGVQDGDVLISTKPLRLDSAAPRRIVAVCKRPFTNVPRDLIRQAPPAHAAAFSDGGTTLLSARQFAVLDLTSFVPANEIDSLTP